jgi:hypothetical protein
MNDVTNYTAARRAYMAAYQQEGLRYSQAQESGDADTAQAALIQMAAHRSAIDGLDNILRDHQAAIASGPAPSKYGLTEAEREVAHNSFGRIRVNGNYVDISNDEKEALYLKQKQKLHQMRATGEYRQTTEQTG